MTKTPPMTDSIAPWRCTQGADIRVSALLPAPRQAVFEYVFPAGLARFFPGTTFIPAVVGTSLEAGWHTPGLVRTVFFRDGSTSQETLLSVTAPTSFTYRNDRFTARAPRLLLRRLESTWRFADAPNGGTRIEWSYRAVPVNAVARVLVHLFLRRELRFMLVQALTILQNSVEQGRTSGR
jgi:hypothetical protein